MAVPGEQREGDPGRGNSAVGYYNLAAIHRGVLGLAVTGRCDNRTSEDGVGAEVGGCGSLGKDKITVQQLRCLDIALEVFDDQQYQECRLPVVNDEDLQWKGHH